MDHIGSLKPDPRNARRHTPRNVGMIADAMQEVGAARSIVIDEDNVILAGNATIEAAAAAGIERLRIVDADGEEIIAVRRSGLTPEQKRRLALFDNRTAELAEWDEAMIASLAEDTDLSGLFADDELAAILSRLEPAAGLTEPDDVPAPPAEPITQPGDLWQLGRHRLLCGDSTVATDVARMMGGEKAAMVFTDPPYGIGYLPDSNLKKLGKLANDHRDGRWQGFTEFTAFIDVSIQSMLDAMHPGACYYICMGWEHTGDVVDSLIIRESKPYSVLVWDRLTPRMTSYPQDYIPVNEFIVYGWKRGANRKRPGDGDEQTTIWRLKTEKAADMEHTTQKPIAPWHLMPC